MNTKGPIDLIAMDMDGTLLAPHKPGTKAYISQECLAALREADAAGIKLCIASGRMPNDAGFFAKDAGLDMAILSLNGGCCQLTPLGKLVSSSPMNADTAMKLWQMAAEMPLHIGLFNGHELVLNDFATPEEIGLYWGTYILREGSMAKVSFGHHAAEELCSRGLHKMVALSDDHPEVVAALKERVMSELPEVDVSSSWINNIEVNPRGVHKGSGLRQLAELLGIPMERVMAIGDNSNDVSMLEAAGCSVVMANGTRDAKAACGWQTLSNAEDGVAAAIRALAFGQQVKGVSRR